MITEVMTDVAQDLIAKAIAKYAMAKLKDGAKEIVYSLKDYKDIENLNLEHKNNTYMVHVSYVRGTTVVTMDYRVVAHEFHKNNTMSLTQANGDIVYIPLTSTVTAVTVCPKNSK